MKKIVFVMPQISGGGAERVTAALANTFSGSLSMEVHMAVYTRDPEVDYPVSDRVIWHVYGGEVDNPALRIVGKTRFLRDTVRKIKPDCVLSLAGPEVLALLTAAMTGMDIPLILSERNDPARYPTQKHLRLLRMWAYKKCTGLVFQTHEAMAYYPADVRKKGVVICNPLTGSLPQPHSGPRDKRIVCSCRLEPQKNLDLLLDAFSDIVPRFPEHTLWIYGEGGERARLEARIRDLGLEQRVFLPGFCPDLHGQILRAGAFALSSDYEGISNSMLEAIALGIPTVCTDCPVGGARETIRHGENGLLVPVGDRKALAGALEKLLAEPEFAARLGMAGTSLRQTLSARAIAGKWLEFMESVW